MKNQLVKGLMGFLTLFALTFVFACGNGGGSADADADGNSDEDLGTADYTRTTLVITNSTNESVELGIILAALGGGCSADNPPITADQLKAAGFCDNVINSPTQKPYAGKCTATLAAGASVTFPDIDGTCISGNVTFGGYASCPTCTPGQHPPTTPPSTDQPFPNGTTTAEFTLNVASGQEAYDISLVNGYSGVVTMSTSGGDAWQYGQQTGSPTTTSSVTNKGIGQNQGNPGVYPVGCTDCIQLVGNIVCPCPMWYQDSINQAKICQTERICNVQRDAGSGGTLTITLVSMDTGSTL